jgi:bifunctional enzyme CysN/CysC
MPVQWVNRPNQDFRGFAGLIVGGSVRPGDLLRVLPSGLNGRVARIVTADGDLQQAVAGQSVTLTLKDEIDISRGDLLTAAAAPASVSDKFEATVVWMSDEPMLPGRPYLLKCGTRTVTAAVAPLKYKINVNTLEELAARQLELNEIGLVNLNLDQPLPFDPYARNRDTGGFILIDRINNNTVGAGMLLAALRPAQDVQWQALDVDRANRSVQKNQRACVLWFTGLSGVGEVARLMTDAGLIVLVSFISPFRSERQLARSLLGPGEFFEIFIDTPLEVAEARDPKGLYRKARAGKIRNFTGIDSPYEPPENPEMHIDTGRVSAEQAAEQVIGHLRLAGIIDRDWVFIP